MRGKKAALAKGDTELTHEIGEGKDIISILSEFVVRSVAYIIGDPLAVRANKEAAVEDRLPDDEVLAQMSYVPNHL